MANIRMAAPPGCPNGTHRISDGSTVTVAAGFASVTPQQWQAATVSGFVHDDPTQANSAPFRTMTAPTTGVWPVSGTITAPDGASITVTAGKALIPAAWCNYYQGMGWQPIPGHG